MNGKLILTICLGVSILSGAYGQEEANAEFRKHCLGYYSGISLVPNAIEGGAEDNERTLLVRSIGLDYDYRIDHHWMLGCVYDLQFATFLLSTEDGLLLRENVMVLCVYAGYEYQRFGITFGTGIEYELHKSLAVGRLGLEYNLYLANDWWVIPEVSLEFKEIYTNYNIGFRIAKSFGSSLSHSSH